MIFAFLILPIAILVAASNKAWLPFLATLGTFSIINTIAALYFGPEYNPSLWEFQELYFVAQDLLMLVALTFVTKKFIIKDKIQRNSEEIVVFTILSMIIFRSTYWAICKFEISALTPIWHLRDLGISDAIFNLLIIHALLKGGGIYARIYNRLHKHAHTDPDSISTSSRIRDNDSD